ncbi:DegT/DnrJ/EryC1/StrS family aminotransferase [Flavobacterium sediminilitoris]|uniref:DegT/DnrJ/EryC1/StrS family aminotransferase n=1 Tax=Flavobacterium sediminilitoris TaxID=2024526 RepID=A0ABY4HLD8_9FLAO|nr:MULTISPECIES: DegT/DnrJ/EryC1/StrS family aminotransferase [Flavobacterium]UOX33672.1 DegT/DnrJ/EryC1/StrS family aminotransferase [Flavobacterium sediminilitoris]
MVNVTKTFLPPLEEYQNLLKKIWENEWLTNRGQFTLELEEKLKIYLGLDNILITNNGTIPLQIALKLLGNNGEIITTPFSYVATTSSIIWENCKPIFVDINEDFLTIDETKIENAITPNTTAILATHVFGNPCHIEEIEKIAKKHKLYIIYDAAHCFGVKYKNQSIFKYGTISTCSFHATKIFHTGEGGAIISNDKELTKKIYYSHNFGHDGPLNFHGLGINAKISELQSAMGITVLNHIDTILKKRKEVVDYYNTNLNLNKLKIIKIRENTEWNYSYYPIILSSENKLLEVQKELNIHNIFPRRYFYPSLNTIKYVNGEKMPISESISSRVLCLPLYAGIDSSDLKKIVSIVNKTIC